MDKFQDSLSKLQDLVKGVKRDYISWVVKNPSRASDTESSIKLLSYLLHGRLKKSSAILPELIYCGANVLAFWHDHLIEQYDKKRAAAREGLHLNSNGHATVEGSDGPSRSAASVALDRSTRIANIERIKSTLTIIDYLEVFLEISARQLWGDFGRWVVILLLQAVKTGLRAALLFHYNVGMIGSSTLYTRRYIRRRVTPNLAAPAPSVTFVLKHSGRTVRKINSAPPVGTRDWSIPTVLDAPMEPQELTPSRKLAEVAHLLRPLTHLACMGVWGTKSWKPWLVSIAMDMTSLKLHSQYHRLQRHEKIELTRRAYSLCYYLMRSPFYDTCTKKRLLGTLVMFSERIPLLGNICGVLAQAIPEWQTTYSYMWTDC